MENIMVFIHVLVAAYSLANIAITQTLLAKEKMKIIVKSTLLIVLNACSAD